MRTTSFLISSLFFLAITSAGFTGCSHTSRLSEGRHPLRVIQSARGALRGVRRVALNSILFSPEASELLSRSQSLDLRLSELATGLLGVEIVPKGSQGEGADAILQTEVLRFTGREGNALGTEEPAAVGVRYFLYDKNSELIWEANYHFQDKALTDDLFSANNRFSKKSGAGWRDAYELLEESMEQALTKLEYEREKSYLR